VTARRKGRGKAWHECDTSVRSDVLSCLALRHWQLMEYNWPGRDEFTHGFKVAIAILERAARTRTRKGRK
jgi:hypothetical protein